MEALAERGSILMRRLSYYTDLENRAQGDPNEGLLVRYSAENPTLSVVFSAAGRSFPLRGASLTVLSRKRKHGVFCLYGIETDEYGQTSDRVFGDISEDPEIAQFDYDGLVLIQNPSEFDRRLRAAALREGFMLDLRLIEYVPASHCGDMGPFRKLESFAYQKEVRYLTTRPIPKGGLKLTLGPLGDIVTVFNVGPELARGKTKRAGAMRK